MFLFKLFEFWLFYFILFYFTLIHFLPDILKFSFLLACEHPSPLAITWSLLSRYLSLSTLGYKSSVITQFRENSSLCWRTFFKHIIISFFLSNCYFFTCSFCMLSVFYNFYHHSLATLRILEEVMFEHFHR